MKHHQNNQGYVDSTYLSKADASVRPIKERSYERMKIRQGDVALDLGCGIGIDTLLLSQLVGLEGKVYGVDHDPQMIQEANERTLKAGKQKQVNHLLGQANSIPFPDEYFDASRSERLLMHLAEPEKAVAELYRVLKQDGYLVLIEPDWATLSFFSQQVETERQIARIRGEQFLKNGYVGRMLYPLMSRQGFRDLQVEIFPFWSNDLEFAEALTVLRQVEDFAISHKLLTKETVEQWRTDLHRSQSEGAFYASMNLVMVSGRK